MKVSSLAPHIVTTPPEADENPGISEGRKADPIHFAELEVDSHDQGEKNNSEQIKSLMETIKRLSEKIKKKKKRKGCEYTVQGRALRAYTQFDDFEALLSKRGKNMDRMY